MGAKVKNEMEYRKETPARRGMAVGIAALLAVGCVPAAGLAAPAPAWAGGPDAAVVSVASEGASDYDRANLPDGTYDMAVSLRQAANVTAESMAGGSVNKQAQLVVKDGVYQVVVTLQTMQVMGVSGDITAMSLFPQGYVENGAAVVQGNAVEGAVLSTRVSDADGKTYPATMGFPVEGKAKQDGYLVMQVESTGMGGAASVVLALDWDAFDDQYGPQEPAADKSALKARLDAAAKLSQGAAPDVDWAVLQGEVRSAQQVYDDADATEAEVDAATRAMSAAIDRWNDVPGAKLEVGKPYLVADRWVNVDGSASSAGNFFADKVRVARLADGGYQVALPAASSANGLVANVQAGNPAAAAQEFWVSGGQQEFRFTVPSVDKSVPVSFTAMYNGSTLSRSGYLVLDATAATPMTEPTVDPEKPDPNPDPDPDPDPAPDPDQGHAALADGTYSLSYQVTKPDGTSVSMSAGAFVSPATLSVKNGAYTLSLNLQGIKIQQVTAYAGSISYYEDPYSLSGGSFTGAEKAATVVETQVGSDGKTYPKTVEFPLVKSAYNGGATDGRVPLSLYVPLMQTSNPVLLTLDWSTLEAESPSPDPDPDPSPNPNPDPTPDPDPNPDPTPDPDLPTFLDVVQGTWYYQVVGQAAEQGYLNGYAGTNLFGPNDTLTRGQAACVMLNLDASKGEGTGFGSDATLASVAGFSDVAASAYYADAVSWAKGAGVMSGYAGTTLFGPEDAITREQVAVILYNYERQQGGPAFDGNVGAAIAAYPDGTAVSGWAREAVAWAIDRDIMGGNAVLAPEAPITRAEMASMVVNYAQ